jgi:hypothetical protein
VTSKQLIYTITNTCETLFNLGLVFCYNKQKPEICGEQTQISWSTRQVGTTHLHHFGSLEQYSQWLADGEYTCLLADYSIIRASFTIEFDKIVKHSLLYWPFPINTSTKINDITDALEAISIILDSISKSSDIVSLSMRSPMRFDYDPKTASVDHPETHLHTQFEDTRIFVQRPLSFNTFIKLVFKNFYHNTWKQHHQINELHEQKIDPIKGDILPTNHHIQLAWA